MIRTIPVKTVITPELITQNHFDPRIPIGTLWEFEHYRKGRLIDQWKQGNITTDEGLDAFLNIMFGTVAKITPWYIGVFESDTTPLAAHTYAVPGYTECVAYTEGARVEFIDVPAASQIMSNVASKAIFTFNATKTIYGAALVGGGSAPSDNTDKVGGGTLFASSKFGTSKSVVSTDVLLVTCTITLTDV